MTDDRTDIPAGDSHEQLRESIRMLLGLDGGTPGVLQQGLKEFHPVEIAEILQDFDEGEAAQIIAALPPADAAEVITETDPMTRIQVLDTAEGSLIGELVETLPPDEGADILELLSKDDREEVLGSMGAEQAHELRKLEEYDPDSAGGIMTTRFVAVSEEATTDEALLEVRSSPDVESFHYVYVVDADKRLKGVVSARQLVFAPKDTGVSSLMERDVVTVDVGEDQEVVASVVQKYDLAAVPVIDGERRVLGIVMFDDVIDVIDEELSEDIFRLAGTAATHPTREPVWKRVLLRLPWLLVTLTGGMIVAMVISRYEDSSSFPVVIFFFIPAINAMGGNVGIQSSTIMVRGIATGEVEVSRLLRILMGEIKVGALLGLFFSVATGLFVYTYYSHFPGNMEGSPAQLAFAVAIAMSAGILASALVGTLVPVACSRIGIDPAITAGPFVTVLNDICCTAIYFTTATVIIARAL